MAWAWHGGTPVSDEGDLTTLDESIRIVDLEPGDDELTLLIVSGPEAGRWVRVPPEGGMIGRHVSCAVRLSDPAVSRRHAIIESTQSGAYRIRDRESRNGLFVDGQRVPAHLLSDGDQIQLSSATVVRARIRSADETKLIDELQRAASMDSLTSVANRRHLMSRLTEELSFAWRHRAPVSLLMIDLDRFKEVNDQLGHHTGDSVLRKVATLLRTSIRTEDVLGRYGGDEFVIIARGYGIEGGSQFAERLCRIARERIVSARGSEVTVTLSIGLVACEDPDFDEDRPDPMEILARADAALYARKHAGRDGFSCWAPPTPSRPPSGNWHRATQHEIAAAKLEGDDEPGPETQWPR